MSNQAEKSSAGLPADLQKHGAALDAWFDQRLEKKLKEVEENKTPSLSIIATKGTMDWAYPPFILASTASALGWEVNIFFTFYGLELLKKDLHLEVSALGNPSMPMKMPFGPKWFQGINWNIPNLVMAGVPGFEKVATGLMKKTVKNNGVASIEELRDACIEADVKLLACQMTVDLFGYKHEEFIPEVKDWVGAAWFLPVAQKSDVCLFI
ncbi:MAG: DsrE/DsrF/DrsH-like family protein [Gammaproteobacteria bacterium]|nr:DsrE/DsrF/DrsH-like family protein [Gammaproteobacteria bacterium]MDH3370009.1 DsrE/DsrF/DrsH-like family protein [Gammaproteobacteria bacterium]MDH3406790.1 DsrE/DsrF/DrsH-like family protein [Gammaproteobacteria bacterium]MDH5487502.1 DsrE/DsrF/DrsH-like family protein [Gammaproteobacteria bacterium]